MRFGCAGCTARRASRAPFALLNLSRYALLPRDPADRPWSARIADGVLRLLGLALTLVSAAVSPG
ncbi:MAG: hypothetical protein LH603_06165 [Pseudonocardia sp.]|nr:hypothetical protein [Pseudonocardia sp.]